eukprot:g26142.t1
MVTPGLIFMEACSQTTLVTGISYQASVGPALQSPSLTDDTAFIFIGQSCTTATGEFHNQSVRRSKQLLTSGSHRS